VLVNWQPRHQQDDEAAGEDFEVAEATYRQWCAGQVQGPARSDLGERWPSRLVATAEEDRLNI